jgi:hypothetical protein
MKEAPRAEKTQNRDGDRGTVERLVFGTSDPNDGPIRGRNNCLTECNSFQCHLPQILQHGPRLRLYRLDTL